MIQSTFLLTTVIFVGLAFFLMEECQFLIPYRTLLFQKYGAAIATFTVCLFVNVYTALYVVGRRFFLKDTGRKLAHLEKQLRAGDFSRELSERLKD